MGSSPSKQRSKEDGRASASMHSMSLPTNRSRLGAMEDGKKFSWKSRLSSIPRLSGRERFKGMFSLSPNLQQVIEEETEVLEEECMGLKQKQVISAGIPRNNVEKSLRRTVSFQPTWSEARTSTSQRSQRKELSGSEISALNLSLKLDCGFDFLPHKDSVMERSVGLRSLLNPVLMPFHGFVSPARLASDPNKALASRRSFYLQVNDRSPGKSNFCARSSSFRGLPIDNSLSAKLELSPEKSSFHARSSSFCDLPSLESPQKKFGSMSRADILAEPSGSPLFDPSLLATFEKALECLADDGRQCINALDFQSDDSHQSSDSNANDNSSMASESESSSDIEVPHLLQAGIDHCEDFDSVSCQDIGLSSNPSILRANAFLSRKISFSRVFSLKNDENWSGKDYLNRFEMICPPGGENKVVLYFTSLRAVRRTFENCCMLRLILKGLRIHVDERDVWMHSKFRKELTEVMGSTLPVPRLFILGRHIGGAEEVEQLHEEGIMEKMLEGLATDARQECQVCADVRFIPCATCFGSCKFVSDEDVIERCPDCNENGLIMCPHCDW